MNVRAKFIGLFARRPPMTLARSRVVRARIREYAHVLRITRDYLRFFGRGRRRRTGDKVAAGFVCRGRACVYYYIIAIRAFGVSFAPTRKRIAKRPYGARARARARPRKRTRSRGGTKNS